MSRRRRARITPSGLQHLESRLVLSSAQLPGNVGEVLQSQYEPRGITEPVGLQTWGLTVGGPVKIELYDPALDVEAGKVDEASTGSIVNSGLIGFSQFNGGGFSTIGAQIRQTRLGRGLTISGFDTPERDLDAGSSPSAAQAIPGQARVNTNLIWNSQFQDGGFGTRGSRGRVGLQWNRVRVRGGVDIGMENLVYQPGVTKETSQGGVDPIPQFPLSPTNVGRIRRSQFNDGGFGDLGMQWMGVGVGGRVATSTNTLFIHPKQDQLGPLTFENMNFGFHSRSGTTGSLDRVRAASVEAQATTSSAAGPYQEWIDPSRRKRFINDATNSGRIVGTQFNDGGFGDVGLQWRKVRVGRDVTAVHNALTVQPTNAGQGLITVRNVTFPARPYRTPESRSQPAQRLSPHPALVTRDGQIRVRELPQPTEPFRQPHAIVPVIPTEEGDLSNAVEVLNGATNSGRIHGGQFNAGGFGDLGMQWLKVEVGQGVELVHNSLSVHPLGSKLEGIEVSGVTFGEPVRPDQAKWLSVLPNHEARSVPLAGPGVRRKGFDDPHNDRWLRNQQRAKPDQLPVFIQWNGVGRERGLIIVQNLIDIRGVQPVSGPVTLEDIRFVGAPPFVQSGDSSTGLIQAAASGRPMSMNATNNSGILSHNQFSDGGFGSLGLQWRNVKVGGQVSVVQNTLSVNATADRAPGDIGGPITISDITFNSGVFGGPLSARQAGSEQVITTPPAFQSRLSSPPQNRGLRLTQDPYVTDESTNSGIFTGGQLIGGGGRFGLLQWQNVRIPGNVTIIQNVLDVNLGGQANGPVKIAHVTFL